MDQVNDTRISKHIILQLKIETEEIACRKVYKAFSKLPANLIMASFAYGLKQQ